MSGARAWTPEELDIVRALAEEGRSAGQMAHVLDRSRNGIIGACHRNGITLRGQPAGNAVVTLKKKKKNGHRRDFKRYEAAAKETGTKYAPKQEGSLWRLPATGMCKFIYGEGEGMELCGHKALPNRSYCKTHHDFCHTNDGWVGGRPRKETRNGE